MSLIIKNDVEKSSTIRVVMAKEVASRWLSSVSHGEFRFTIFGLGTVGDTRKFASVLRSWRDGKSVLRTWSDGPGKSASSIASIPDLGVRELGDVLEVWSSDAQALRKLAAWVEARGLETTFIW